MSWLQRTEVRLFLTVWLVYGFYVVMHSPFHNVDALVVAMVDRGTFEIDPRVIGDYAVVDGKRYSGYSPGLSWILAPLYWASKPLCSLAPPELRYQAFTVLAGWLITIPLGALAVVALYRLLVNRAISQRAALLTALAFAFGTMWFVYGRRHNSYSFVAAALIFLAFCLIEHAARSRRPGALLGLAGFLGALGVSADYKSAVALAWVGAYALWRLPPLRAGVCFGAGALFPAVAVLAYNAHLFGHPLYTPAKFQVAHFGHGTPLQEGMLPLVGGYDFRWEWFWKQFFGPRTGFFLYMPVTLLAWIGLVQCWREGRDRFPALAVLTAGMMLSLAFVAAGFVFWHGSGDKYYQGPGTRYLIAALPFVMILVGHAVERMKPALPVALLGVSVAIAWMFVLSANYGKGESPHAGGWENNPFVYHARYLARTYGAESVWFKLLSSGRFGLSETGAALVTWGGAVLTGLLVWRLWRNPKPA